MKNINNCEHCGPTPVVHEVEKLGVWLDHYTSFLNKMAGFVLRMGSKVFHGRVSYFVIRSLFGLFALLGVGRFVRKFDDRMSYRSRVIWESAERLGIEMVGFMFFNTMTDVFFAKLGNKRMVFDALPRPIGRSGKSLEWMDNKGILRKKFTQSALPMSKGFVLGSVSQGLEKFKIMDKPVIVKPSEGSRSRHTTINIQTEEELKKAILVAKDLSPWFILEEQLEGFVYRATVIGGRVEGVMRRLPPGVYGDGEHSIKELVNIENLNPLRKGPIFHELETGQEAQKELVRQGKAWSDVLKKGEFVSLHPKVGRSSGAGNIDVTDETHEENIKLFEKIAKVLDDDLVGIDFIVADITKPWHEQKKSGVIECNSLPFIDLHHYPLEGKSRDVATSLWYVVFPELKAKN